MLDGISGNGRVWEARMVVLAVTWVAKPGHEDEVARDLLKLAGGLASGARMPDVRRPSASRRSRGASSSTSSTR